MSVGEESSVVTVATVPCDIDEVEVWRDWTEGRGLLCNVGKSGRLHGRLRKNEKEGKTD